MNLHTISLFVQHDRTHRVVRGLRDPPTGRRPLARGCYLASGPDLARVTPPGSEHVDRRDRVHARYGLVMTRVQWTFMTPWVLVAMVVAVMFVVLGVLVVGRSLTRIARASRESEGPISGEARTLLAAPVLWSTVLGMNGAALGVVWLMTTKPGWGGLDRNPARPDCPWLLHRLGPGAVATHPGDGTPGNASDHISAPGSWRKRATLGTTTAITRFRARWWVSFNPAGRRYPQRPKACRSLPQPGRA